MKKFALCFLLFPLLCYSQDDRPENWFTQYPNKNLSVQGVGADEVLDKYKKKKSRKIVVAVIDSGVDIEHVDLQGKIWKNEDEIAGNQIDDDNNGYIDDINGWNFIGGKNNENVNGDTYEVTREYARLKVQYNDTTKSYPQNEEYEYWLKIKDEYLTHFKKAQRNYNYYVDMHNNAVSKYDTLCATLNKKDLTFEEIEKWETEDEYLKGAQSLLLYFAKATESESPKDIFLQIEDIVHYYESQVQFGYNENFDSRKIIGDDWANPYEKGYGNSDVSGPDPSHGTHVAGIIAANRNNNIGIKGIAENVEIMTIRAVPDGDERDKDVANAIRYAVDNGAHIINMSFGKGYSYRKYVVDEAIQYADENNVLMIHAAGNSSANNDESDNFPTPLFENGEKAKCWLEIGASSWKANEDLVASFSNYGKKNVDIFAPGVDINSTFPNNQYNVSSGTSMATPATSGVAALLMSYFPYLKAHHVKEIILESCRKFDDLEVNCPGKEEKILFSELSATGGIVDAVAAFKIAKKWKRKK